MTGRYETAYVRQQINKTVAKNASKCAEERDQCHELGAPWEAPDDTGDSVV